MLTGMRALDLQGRITYVNAGLLPDDGLERGRTGRPHRALPLLARGRPRQLHARLDDELNGRIPPGGFQVRVKRKDGTLFDARLYVSPLIDAMGQQTGWMTSMTDITEPNRIREQLSASYERFTTVLEALDASVSVAPLGSEELLFANKLYRLWFGDAEPAATCSWSTQAGMPEHAHQRRRPGRRGWPGRPAHRHPDRRARPENAEIYVRELGKWLEVRTRYLTWVDGRLAQMVIATDITPRRHGRGAVRRAGRARPDRQPPDHHGRNGLQRGARTEPAADRHQQLLQRHGVAHQGQADHRGGPAGRAGKDRASRPSAPARSSSASAPS